MPSTGIFQPLPGWGRILVLVNLTLLIGGCAREPAPRVPARAFLTGRAVLPADTFADGPPVGHQLDHEINGRKPPFSSVPVQGFSSLIKLDHGNFLALQDNGFGTLANSPDCPLRWYELQINLDNPPPAGGTVDVLGFVDLGDPDRILPFALAGDDSSRQLTGADLDPESFVALPDGTFWLGEEFGPSLVHFSASGHVLEKPVAIPIPAPLRDYARGSPYYRTPDHPDLRFLRHTETREELANQPRSGGVEGLALNPSGSLAYVAIEKGLRDDPQVSRRVILEFDPVHRSFTGNYWFYYADKAEVSLASLEAVNSHVLLVLERDTAAGREALIKRIYRVDLSGVGAGNILAKGLVCDLLNIDDTKGLTEPEKGTVGLGPHYSFPYVTPECLVVLDKNTLLVANDNNYPMSVGRHSHNTPDDNEFIRLELNRSADVAPKPTAN